MGYTRYNYVKKNSNIKKVIIVFLILVLLALGVGTILSKIIFKDIDGGSLIPNPLKKDNAPINQKDGNKKEAEEYIIFQGGYYSKKENAEEANNKFKEKYSSFVSQDGDKYRVIITLVKPQEAEKIAEALTKDGLNFIKTPVYIKREDLMMEEIIESIEALMQINVKLGDSQVKGIKTAELKKWSSELEKPKEKSKNTALLEDINNYIKALPEEIKKENQKDLLSYIYSLVVKFKV
ncbi:hypothetical protein [Clostridium polynesiense]|uniref:hypothetical protein n=1 Tax=Clostridium polynesiense TaxID=1325933 RepID=UPI00058E212D|nr:hypothetical protein [Clostridium polynesiense]